MPSRILKWIDDLICIMVSLAILAGIILLFHGNREGLAATIIAVATWVSYNFLRKRIFGESLPTFYKVKVGER